jgi:hypothetical protein
MGARRVKALVVILSLVVGAAGCALPEYRSKLKEPPVKPSYHKMLFFDDLAYIESLLPEDPDYGYLSQLEVTPHEISLNVAKRLLHEAQIKCLQPSLAHTNIQVYNDLFYVNDFAPYMQWAISNRGNALLVPWVEGNTWASRPTIYVYSAKHPGKILMRFYGMEGYFKVFDIAEIEKIKSYGGWNSSP